MLPLPIKGMPYRLAIDGHMADLIGSQPLPNPVAKTLLKLVGINQHEYPTKGVMGGDAMLQCQKASQPPFLTLGILRNVFPALSTSNHSTDGHDENLEQVMLHFVVASGVVDLGKCIDELLRARWSLRSVGNSDLTVSPHPISSNFSCVSPVEDADFDGWGCYLENDGFAFFVRAYREVIARWGGDHAFGRKLYAFFQGAGIPDAHVDLVTPLHLADEGKILPRLTLEATAEAIRAEGIASEDELNTALQDLAAFTAEPHSLIFGPRIFQLWWRR